METQDTFDYMACAKQAILTFTPISINEKCYRFLLSEINDFPYIVTYNGICRIYKKNNTNNYSIMPVSTYLKLKVS